ncbi:MAG: CAP domain-containing protein [Planctomycetes bacterium]|nr:CAP domain-containing protein [Planctomycetota bacterium]
MNRSLALVLIVSACGALTVGCNSSKKDHSTRGQAAPGVAGVASFQVTVATAGGGAGQVTLDPPSATGWYPDGTTVQVTAAPDATTSYFAGWGGDLAGQTASTVQLTVRSALQVSARFERPAAGAPRADFTSSPARPSGVAPFSVTFTDASTGSPTAWRWDLGDGRTATGRTVTHTYTSPGRYTVTLQAENQAGPGLPAIKRDLVVVVDRDAGSPYWYVDDTYGNPLKTHTASEATLAQQVLSLVNQERAAAGLAPLQADAQAERAAKAHVEDMAGRRYFDHVSPEGWTPSDRMRMTKGTGYRMVGENIAVGQRSAQAVMNAWMASPGHRANILDARYTHLGVGVDEPSWNWCQVFLTR